MGLLYPSKDGARPLTKDANGIALKAMSYEAGPGKFGDPDGAKSTTDTLYRYCQIKLG